MKIGNYEFQIPGHTYVIGILNVTEDSFSDGGKYTDPDEALRHVEKMIEDGADMIDIGGESSRPGTVYSLDGAEEEIQRVLPVIKAIKSHFDIPLSLDTYRSRTARAGIEAGVDMVNDIWGLRFDPDMAKTIAENSVTCCLMHNRREAVYSDLVREVLMDLAESIRLAEEAGIVDARIILDPGIGFGKTCKQNLRLMNILEEFHMFGHPVLLGASRKSVIGDTLGLPVEERLEGTLATSAVAVMKGCSFIRVHDVKENVRVVKMAEAIRNAAG